MRIFVTRTATKTENFEMQAQECPACGSEKIGIDRRAIFGVALFCGACRLSGPSIVAYLPDAEERAVASWNRIGTYGQGSKSETQSNKTAFENSGV